MHHKIGISFKLSDGHTNKRTRTHTHTYIYSRMNVHHDLRSVVVSFVSVFVWLCAPYMFLRNFSHLIADKYTDTWKQATIFECVVYMCLRSKHSTSPTNNNKRTTAEEISPFWHRWCASVILEYVRVHIKYQWLWRMCFEATSFCCCCCCCCFRCRCLINLPK